MAEPVGLIANQLLLMLRETDGILAKVVEQYEVMVAEGRVEKVPGEKKRPRKKNETVRPGDVRRRDLTAEERLSALLDLIEVAVCGTVDVTERVADMGREYSDVDSEGSVLFSEPTLDHEDINAPLQKEVGKVSVTSLGSSEFAVADDVLRILGELRQATQVERGEWLVPHEDRRRRDRAERSGR